MTRQGITTCTKCAATWTGYRPAHCARCHDTFTSHAAFDRHLDVNYDRQPPVKCRDPADAGLRINHRGWWTSPMPPEALAGDHQGSTMTGTCRHGHPWTDANTYTSPRGRRRCRACRQATQARARRDARENPGAHAGHNRVRTTSGKMHCKTCYRGDADIDDIAVERAVTGDPPAGMTIAEREAAITQLDRRGLSRAEIADRVGCTVRTVSRVRVRVLVAAEAIESENQ